MPNCCLCSMEITVKKFLTSGFGTKQHAERKGRANVFRPGYEILEGRDLMSVGPEFHVNTTTVFDQNQVAVASQPVVNGRSVAAWTSVDEIGSGGQNVRAQVFDGAGNRVGGEINVA